MPHATVTVVTVEEAQQEVVHHLVDHRLEDPLVEQVLIIYLYSKWGKNIDDMLHFAGKTISIPAEMKEVPTGDICK